MSDKTFNFKEQLAQGHKGEEKLLEIFPVKLTRTEGRKEDFIIEGTDLTVELKTDSYDPTKTANYFMERFSVQATQAPGGPWQSLSKGVHYYVYMFSKTSEFTIFRNVDLVEHLTKQFVDKDAYQLAIRNNGYTTTGYKVNRESIKHLEIDIKEEVRKHNESKN